MEIQNLMAHHNELGKIGEDRAADYLQQHGHVILDRNWRVRRLELDIVCMKSGLLVVVEVKTRNTNDMRLEELLNYKKRCNLRRAANAYVKAKNSQSEVRFDLILICGEKQEIEHIKEAIQVFE